MSRDTERARSATPDQIIGPHGVQERLGLGHRNSVHTLRYRWSRPHVPEELRFPDTWPDDPRVHAWDIREIDAWQARRQEWLASRRRRRDAEEPGQP